MLEFTLENELYTKGFSAVCGLDEAGRGPLCGNVVAAAVILPTDLLIPDLKDSKKLSAKKRDMLYDIIIEKAIAYAIASATPEEIDQMNILNASLLAMRRAVDMLPIKADFALIDGNQSRGFSIPTKTVVKGDNISPSIAAASILAKVTRDRECEALHRLYPEYNIAKHKGYPTKEHMDAVRKYGPSPCHRKSFLSFLNR